MRKTKIALSLLLVIGIGCTSKKEPVEEQSATQHSVIDQNPTITTPHIKENQDQLKLIGTSPALYAQSEEKILNMLNEQDQVRLQKAIQIVSNYVAETIDIYTKDDEIDHEKWNLAYCKKIDGLTFEGIIALAEEILKDSKKKSQHTIKEEIANLKDNSIENQEESLSFWLEELKKANNLPVTIDTYLYSEECFL
ncbi:hypothetical protein [Myroides odoratus]|uniref:hypothetical protein n=1 Tax=Myroides odoratus TaxID=256 RepID=UPI0039AF6806